MYNTLLAHETATPFNAVLAIDTVFDQKSLTQLHVPLQPSELSHDGKAAPHVCFDH